MRKQIEKMLTRAAWVLAAAVVGSCSPLLGSAAGNPGVVLADDISSDLTVTGLRLNDGEARWDRNEKAYKYTVKLYRNSKQLTTKTTGETYYDFSSNFTGKGDYYFTVQATGQSGTRGDVAQSEYIYVDREEARDIRGYSDDPDRWDDYPRNPGPGVKTNGFTNPGASGYQSGNSMNSATRGYGSPMYTAGTWKKDGNGWWYQFMDNTYPKNCWENINGLYYCFDQYGYMRTGWIDYNGYKYYCGPDGALQANTTTPDGYRLDSQGRMIR